MPDDTLSQNLSIYPSDAHSLTHIRVLDYPDIPLLDRCAHPVFIYEMLPPNNPFAESRHAHSTMQFTVSRSVSVC